MATVGPTNDFPSFYSRLSGHLSPLHVRNEQEAAELIRKALPLPVLYLRKYMALLAFLESAVTHQQLHLQSGILLAVPIPQEEEIPPEDIERWLEQALSDAQ